MSDSFSQEDAGDWQWRHPSQTEIEIGYDDDMPGEYDNQRPLAHRTASGQQYWEDESTTQDNTGFAAHLNSGYSAATTLPGNGVGEGHLYDALSMPYAAETLDGQYEFPRDDHRNEHLYVWSICDCELLQVLIGMSGNAILTTAHTAPKKITLHRRWSSTLVVPHKQRTLGMLLLFIADSY